MFHIYLNPPVGSEIWAPKNPPKTDCLGLKFDTQTEGHSVSFHCVWVTHVFRELSNEKNPGWLFDIGDYTNQLYRDYNKPL